jgi:peroxiredoxin
MQYRHVLLGSLAAACFATAPMAAGVPQNANDVKPLAVGSKAPSFVVRNPDGSDRRFEASAYKKPAVFIFYRGGWCPYCNGHLKALKAAEPELLKMGYDLYFLSADKPEILFSSLKEPDIKYTLLSDARMTAARAFGIAFRVDDETYKKYQGYGIDLEQASGEKHHELPVPAVFIVDRGGVVRFAHANADYSKRLENAPLISAARRALNGSKKKSG